MQVGENALFFPSTFKGSIDQFVSKYIVYVRKNPNYLGQLSPLLHKSTFDAFSRRFFQLRNDYKGSLSEIFPEIDQLRKEVAAVVTQHKLDWPDFAWNWDSTVPLMGMLMALCAGPMGRRDLPAHLLFPPADLVILMSRGQFYDHVADFLLNIVPDQDTPPQKLFTKFSMESTLCNAILVTAVFGARFQFDGNFSIVDGKPAVKFMLNETLDELPGALLRKVGLARGQFAIPAPCVHNGNGGPRDKFVNCQECVELNDKDKKPMTLRSELMKKLVMAFALAPDASMLLTEMRNLLLVPGVELVSVIDAIFWIVDVYHSNDPQHEGVLQTLDARMDAGGKYPTGAFEELLLKGRGSFRGATIVPVVPAVPP